MLVTLPFALVLLDVWPMGRLRIGAPPVEPPPLPQRSIGLLIADKSVLFVLAIAFSILRVGIAGGRSSCSRRRVVSIITPLRAGSR